MATQVPYTGVPDIAPQERALPGVQISTPIDAFGGAVAGAVTHLGETAQGVGKEMFARGYAMQEMDQQFKADAATSDAVNKQSDVYLWYDQFKGADRMKMFGEYKDRLRKVRDEGAVDLESPYARLQFLKETRSNEARMIWHGGVLARQGLDEAGKFATKGKIAAIGDQLAAIGVGDGPDFDKSVGELQKTAGNYLVDQGLAQPGTPEYDQGVREMISPHVARIAHNIGRTDPAKGSALLEQYNKKGLVTAEDATRVGPALDNAVEVKGARKVAIEVSRGDPKHWGNEAYGDDVATAGLKAAPGTTGTYNSVGKDLADDTHSVGKYGVNSALLEEKLPGLALKNESGGDVKSEADFLNSPKAQEEFRKTVFADLQKGGSFNDAFRTWAGADYASRLTGTLNGVAKAAPPKMVGDKAAAAMDEVAPGKAVAADNARQLSVQNQNQSRSVDDLSQKQDVHETIRMVTQSQDGRVPQTLDEALKIEGFSDKFHSLDPNGQNAIIKTIDENHSSRYGGVRENDAGALVFSRLRGVALGQNTTSTPEEMEKFVDTDVLSLPISPQHKAELAKLQQSVMKGVIANPAMDHAMRLESVQKLMEDAGISKKDTPEQYHAFQNAYHDALVSYGMGAERSVKNDEELTTIAHGLLRAQTKSTWNPGTWFGSQPVQPYANIYATVPPNIQRLGQSQFSKEYQRAFDPENEKDVEGINRILLRTIYEAHGAKAKPVAGKATQRVQP